MVNEKERSEQTLEAEGRRTKHKSKQPSLKRPNNARAFSERNPSTSEPKLKNKFLFAMITCDLTSLPLAIVRQSRASNSNIFP